jgi:hypothetical protein
MGSIIYEALSNMLPGSMCLVGIQFVPENLKKIPKDPADFHPMVLYSTFPLVLFI